MKNRLPWKTLQCKQLFWQLDEDCSKIEYPAVRYLKEEIFDDDDRIDGINDFESLDDFVGGENIEAH